MSIETIEVGEHIYRGPLPSGRPFMDLYGPSVEIGDRLGLVVAAIKGGRAAFAMRCRQIGAQPGAEQLFLATFKSWTVDGVAITADTYLDLYANPERATEPWLALGMAWELLGFFRLPGFAGPEQPETKPEPEAEDPEKPTDA